MDKTRTFWNHSLILAIPFSRWGVTPYISYPIPFPSHIAEENDQQSKEGVKTSELCQHPFELAMIWRMEMERDPGLTKAKIAVREGISRARVSQIMNLLELPVEIQNGLLPPPVPLEIHSFPERKLRILAQCADATEQVGRWREWVQKLTCA